MWPWPGKPKRDLPVIDYNEDTDEEDSENEFGLPENAFASPRVPHHTRAGSPAEEASVYPSLADNVDEDLVQVRQTLQNIGHTPIFRPVQPEDTEEVVTGIVIGQADTKADLGDENEAPPVARMVNYDKADGEDEEKAMQSAINAVRNVKWDPDDVAFFFKQAEIKMKSNGVAKNFTKLEVITTILPKNVIDEVKTTSFENYKVLSRIFSMTLSILR